MCQKSLQLNIGCEYQTSRHCYLFKEKKGKNYEHLKKGLQNEFLKFKSEL
jgi:hypothetical protein